MKKEVLNLIRSFQSDAWDLLSPEEKKEKLLSDEVLKWFSANIGNQDAALILSRVAEVADSSINEKYLNVFAQMIVSQKEGQNEKCIDDLINHVLKLEIADTDIVGILQLIFFGLVNNIDENYQALQVICRLWPNDMHIKGRFLFAEADKRRVENFKKGISPTDVSNIPSSHELIKNALHPFFLRPKINVLDELLDQKEYVFLTRVFAELNSLKNDHSGLILGCEVIAEKIIKKLVSETSEVGNEEKEIEKRLFSELEGFASKVASIKEKAKEKIEEDVNPQTTKGDKEKYFSVKNWKANKKVILDKFFDGKDVDHAISRALDNLARHAKLSLNKSTKSERAEVGREKYNELQELFERLSKVDTLEAAKHELEAILDQNPKQTTLLKNRGGFGGLYEKVSEALGKHGLFHFHYEHDNVSQNAGSSTHRGLNELYDAITAQVNNVALGL